MTMNRAKRTKSAKKRNRGREIREATAARALLEVMNICDRVAAEGSSEDGRDGDLERGPEDERMIAGERVITFVDKVFGGRGVFVVRRTGSEDLHYPLGRVADCETRSSLVD